MCTPAVIYVVISATQPLPSRPPLLLCARRLPRPCRGDLCVESNPILPHPTARTLSPFAAALTRNQHSCRKTPPVSPFLATLTDTPSRKSFACHSYENTGGYIFPAKIPLVFPSFLDQPLASKFFRMNTCKTVSKQTTLTLFRINTYEKPRGRGLIVNQRSDERCLS